ncbi:MAG: radical SAM family heme chaperone HemW, partial [Pyrinomonadaceae bacterium]
RQQRWSNERDLNRYMKLIEQGSSPVVESQTLSEAETRAEAIFLGLRMMTGINVGLYQEHFGVDLREEYREQLEFFREAGLLSVDDGQIRLTRPGALLSNEVFEAFI